MALRYLSALPALLLLLGFGLLLLLDPGLRGELNTAWGLLWSGDPAPLREWILQFGAWAPLVSGLLQVATALFPPLPGFPIAIANAMVWGWAWGGALTFVSGTIAAAICFGIARWVGRPGVERLVDPEKLARVDGFMERRGILAVFLARLIPFINPDLASYAAGVTSMGWLPFMLGVSAGSVPAVIFYTIVGTAALETTGPVLLLVGAASIVPLLAIFFFRDRISKRTRS